MVLRIMLFPLSSIPKCILNNNLKNLPSQTPKAAAIPLTLLLGIALTIIFIAFSSYGQELKTITPEQFIAESPSNERKAIIDFLVQQFDGKSVNQAQLDSLWNNSKAKEDLHLTRFQIINQKLYASGHDETHPYFRSLIKYFQKLLNNYQIKDVDFIIHTRDELKTTDDFVKTALDIPTFMMSKNLDNPSEAKKLLLPDAFMLWSSYGELLKKIDQANDPNKFNNKINKIYWRGGSTGGAISPYAIENFNKLPRLSLVILSQLYPDIIDARFTHYMNDEAFAKDKDNELRKVLDLLLTKDIKKIDEIDHLKYKYLISIDGYTCAWVRVPWIMYSNSVLVKQETNKIEWFYPAIKPYIHYVPVNERLTDIFTQFEWMKAHDKEVQQIATNAHNFIQNNLMPEHIEAHMALILNKYHEIQKDDKLLVSLPTAEETCSFKGISLAVITRIKRNFINWMKEL